jgi:hypothetical protein
VKVSALEDRKRVNIKSILTRLRSLKRGALTRSNVILFLGNGIRTGLTEKTSLNVSKFLIALYYQILAHFDAESFKDIARMSLQVQRQPYSHSYSS